MAISILAFSILTLPQVQGAPLDLALARFRADHGAQWRIDVDEGTGFAEFLYGGALEGEFVPREDAEWFTLARAALERTSELHGIEQATLIEERALHLPLGFAGTSDKFTLRFRQVVNGVPVDDGRVNVLFDMRGRLLSVQTRALPGVAALQTVPGVTAEQALERAERAFRSDHGLAATQSSTPQLCIAQIERDGWRSGALAWKVDVQRLVDGDGPLGTTFVLDAHTGEVLRRDTSIHYFDVSGTISTRATPGLNPDTGSNPTTVQPLAYTSVSSGSVTATSDAFGNFTLVGVDAPASVIVGYDGAYNNVNNSAGSPHTATFNALTATGNTFVLNTAPTEFVTAQANVNIAVNAMRDWVRSINPSDTHADFVHNAFVNVNSACNAFYNGSSITFFWAASGCVNTAYSTVIAHEDGHWLNVRYGTGNGGDGMGEGNADTWAMYLYDDPIVGRGFCGTNCNIRSGDNTRSFCGDCCPACYGEVHADGEVWMGAAWKIRRNLDLLLGNSAGDAAANTLFLGWMNAYNQGQIKSVIEAQWLTLDDDDGDIDTGTPHFSQIDSAFRQQGFPGLTLQPVYIGSVTTLPDTLDTNGPYVVDAEVYSNASAPLSSVQLFYRTHAGSFVALPMSALGGATFRASIPGQAASTKVYYYVQASNTSAFTVRKPSSAPSVSSFFTVGPTTEVFHDTFEFAQGWNVSNDPSLSGGAWVRGDPLGTFVGTRAAQPEDDDPADAGPSAMFTGQGSFGGPPDDADVDGGPTRLTSPALDLAGTIPQIEFSYWLFNLTGDDSLTVELSPDGSTWFTARVYTGGQGGWQRDVLDVSSYFVPTANVRARFSVADVAGISVTEAALDNVVVRALGANLCAVPQVFCTAKVNSAFCVPTIAVSGTPSLTSSQPFTIGVSRVLNQKSGLFFYGLGGNSAPYKGGFMCAAPPLRRTPTQQTGGNPALEDCTGTMTFDMNAWLQSGADANLISGAQVAGQFYYRDPQDLHTLGLSDAVLFSVCP